VPYRFVPFGKAMFSFGVSSSPLLCNHLTSKIWSTAGLVPGGSCKEGSIWLASL
jgi:hypothetical protein